MNALVAPVKEKRGQGVMYLREQVFQVLAFSILYVGLVVLLVSVCAAWTNKLYWIVVFDLGCYIPLVVAATSRRLSFRVRILITLAIFYLIGLGMFLLLGPYGAGWLWLFAFACSASLLLSFRHALLATLLNLLTILVLGYLIWSGTELFTPYFKQYDINAWLANSANFLGLSIFVSVSFSVLVRSVERNLEHLSQMKTSLRKNRDELLILKRKAEESDRLKSLFLANMSHEIRSPMNAILGFTGLMRRQRFPREKEEEYLSIIDDRGKVLLKIINDILDISRIDANAIKFVPEEVRISDLVTRLWTSYRENPSFPSGKVDFRLVHPQGNEIRLFTDPVRLQQVLSNLINNAFKFTRAGIVQLGYCMGDNEIIFFVKDSGIGIPPAKVNEIFNRFTQADDTHQHSGTGLGLAISKALVEKMGGRIWVSSEVGIGSTFYFAVPSTISLN
ncbi:MAG: ATP-binding protein [Bacteroidales bacterium]